MAGSTKAPGRQCKWCRRELDFPNEAVQFCSDQCKTYFERAHGMAAYLTWAGVPKRFINCTLQGYEGKRQAFAPLADFPERMTMVFFTGNVGAGKTHCAVGLLRDAATRDPRPGRFIHATRLFLDLRGTMSSNTETENYVMSKYIGHCVLVLDDVGAEKPSDYVRECWYHIVETRYSRMKPTIITSNLTLEQIADTYGDRIASRIASGFVMNFRGGDHRLILRQRDEER